MSTPNDQIGQFPLSAAPSSSLPQPAPTVSSHPAFSEEAQKRATEETQKYEVDPEPVYNITNLTLYTQVKELYEKIISTPPEDAKRVQAVHTELSETLKSFQNDTSRQKEFCNLLLLRLCQTLHVKAETNEMFLGIVSWLLEASGNPNYKNTDPKILDAIGIDASGSSRLILDSACLLGISVLYRDRAYALLKILLQFKANPNVEVDPPESICTSMPLIIHAARKLDHVACALLIKHGANRQAKYKDKTALGYILENYLLSGKKLADIAGMQETLSIFLERDSKLPMVAKHTMLPNLEGVASAPSSSVQRPFTAYVTDIRDEGMLKLLAEKWDINQRTADNPSVLICAISGALPDSIIDVLLGASDETSKQLAMYAAVSKHNAILLEKLIKQTQDLPWRAEGKSPLELAMEIASETYTGPNKNEFPCLQLLIRNKRFIHHQNGDGQTALMRALVYSLSEIAAALIQAGVDCKLVDKDGDTHLHYAIMFANDGIFFSIVQQLDYKDRDSSLVMNGRGF